MTYKEFIDDILQTRGRFACGDEYHERHHIVPRCMGGGNEEDNLIDLYAREHFEAHRLLALENPENDGLVCAWWCMSVQTNQYTKERYRITAEEYEEARIIYSHTLSENNKGENNPNYGNHKLAGINNPFYGRKHTDEVKEKISKANRNISEIERKRRSELKKGKSWGKHTDEYKQHMSESLVGGKHHKAKKVIQYSTNNELIKIWDCIRTVEKILNIDHSTITRCCKGVQKTAGGYQWKYLHDQTQKDGTVIPGAITLGLITEEEALRMLEEQKETEGKTYGFQKEDCENN